MALGAPRQKHLYPSIYSPSYVYRHEALNCNTVFLYITLSFIILSLSIIKSRHWIFQVVSVLFDTYIDWTVLVYIAMERKK